MGTAFPVPEALPGLGSPETHLFPRPALGSEGSGGEKVGYILFGITCVRL